MTIGLFLGAIACGVLYLVLPYLYLFLPYGIVAGYRALRDIRKRLKDN